jgi:uncharacterized protein YuzE
MEKTVLKEVRLRPRELHFDYDSARDVLYISFGKPQPAYDSTLPEEGVIYRLSGDQLVGISILNFRGKTRQRRTKN